ncbi:MAG: hypothetical protein U1U88_000841 [Lawsonella clevelandensis]
MHLQVLTLAPTRDSYRQAEPCLATMLEGDAASAYLPAPTTAAGTAALTPTTPDLPHLAADTTLVVATSGTTGDPKYAQLRSTPTTRLRHRHTPSTGRPLEPGSSPSHPTTSPACSTPPQPRRRI